MYKLNKGFKMIRYWYLTAWIKGICDDEYYDVWFEKGLLKEQLEKGKKEFKKLLQMQGYEIEGNKIYSIFI